VNHLWQVLFGQGLVTTPDNFGVKGDKPSHPELLDFLAYWFLDHGESLKSLHRLILTSNTYRQSSAGDAVKEHQELASFVPPQPEFDSAQQSYYTALEMLYRDASALPGSQPRSHPHYSARADAGIERMADGLRIVFAADLDYVYEEDLLVADVRGSVALKLSDALDGLLFLVRDVPFVVP